LNLVRPRGDPFPKRLERRAGQFTGKKIPLEKIAAGFAPDAACDRRAIKEEA